MKSESWSEIYLCKLGLFLKYKSPPDLHEYAGGHSIISKEGCIIPDKIVVIFGESLSRDHMSLYDYTKNTNPLLQSIYDEGSLFLFKNVESATTGTVSSFEQMLSSYRGEDSIEWYRCVTIFDVAKAAGYKTVWMSNQSRVGTYDNIVAKYADLADSTIWIGNAMGVYHKGFDGALVEEVGRIRSSLPEHSLLFVHLMGSHEKFSDRFPPSFAKFSEMDYSEMPKNQRQNLADYDNSVLYNDYVVSSLFELFSEDDAVCMYFPDHGLDIYESSPTFVGHATADSISISAAKKIPFMVYTSDKVKSAQSLFDDIRYASDECQGYVTSNIIYTISDLMGVTMVDESEIQTKSIFHTSQ